MDGSSGGMEEMVNLPRRENYIRWRINGNRRQ
jgi:hypothetical protein